MGQSATERLVAACAECGSMYAALKTPDGTIQPIGSRTGCASCGGTVFIPLPDSNADPTVNGT